LPGFQFQDLIAPAAEPLAPDVRVGLFVVLAARAAEEEKDRLCVFMFRHKNAIEGNQNLAPTLIPSTWFGGLFVGFSSFGSDAILFPFRTAQSALAASLVLASAAGCTYTSTPTTPPSSARPFCGSLIFQPARTRAWYMRLVMERDSFMSQYGVISYSCPANGFNSSANRCKLPVSQRPVSESLFKF
jgi:hypothetical protein